MLESTKFDVDQAVELFFKEKKLAADSSEMLNSQSNEGDTLPHPAGNDSVVDEDGVDDVPIPSRMAAASKNTMNRKLP